MRIAVSSKGGARKSEADRLGCALIDQVPTAGAVLALEEVADQLGAARRHHAEKRAWRRRAR
jgi:hypothetical protein